MEKSRFSTDRIIGLSAMLISVLTLLIFIYQTSIMHRQSRLSVTPRLDFNQSLVQGDSIITIAWSIENKGLGPAIIEDINIVYQKKKYPLDFDKFFEDVFPKLNQYGNLVGTMTMSEGSTISANEENAIYKYRFRKNKLNEIRDYLEINETDDFPFEIEIVYSSIYKERWKDSNLHHGHPIKL